MSDVQAIAATARAQPHTFVENEARIAAVDALLSEIETLRGQVEMLEDALQDIEMATRSNVALGHIGFVARLSLARLRDSKTGVA